MILETHAPLNGIEAIVNNICHELREKGYVITRSIDLNSYRSICNSIGTVAQVSDVKISTGESYINSPDAVPLHTDNPKINIVSWYCLEQDKTEGTISIVDGRELLPKLSLECIRCLLEIKVFVPNKQELFSIFRKEPVFQIYYSPVQWHAFLDKVTTPQKYAMLELERLILSSEQIPILLHAGDSLFLNNLFMFHGRSEINRDSSRHLVRYYITSSN